MSSASNSIAAISKEEVQALLRGDHLVSLRLQRRDQLVPARAIGPDPVAEHDAWFALGSVHLYLSLSIFSNAHQLPRSR